jgi:hypothetical protein
VTVGVRAEDPVAAAARIFGRPSVAPAAPTNQQSVEAMVAQLTQMRDDAQAQVEEMRVAFEVAVADKVAEAKRLSAAVAALTGEPAPRARPKRTAAHSGDRPAKPVTPRPGSLSETILAYLAFHGQTPGRILVKKLVDGGKASNNQAVVSALGRLTHAGNVERVHVDGDSKRPAYRLPGQDETSSRGTA